MFTPFSVTSCLSPVPLWRRKHELAMKGHLTRWASEPFRLFFPLGILAAVAGVMMWPLLYAGHLGFYPGEAHARVMIEGFMGAFVLGFLGTAFPRLTGNATWSRGELALQLLLWLVCVASALTGHVAAAGFRQPVQHQR